MQPVKRSTNLPPTRDLGGITRLPQHDLPSIQSNNRNSPFTRTRVLDQITCFYAGCRHHLPLKDNPIINPDCPLGRKHSVINEFLMVSIRNLPMKSVGSLSNGQSGINATVPVVLPFTQHAPISIHPSLCRQWTPAPEAAACHPARRWPQTSWFQEQTSTNLAKRRRSRL